MAQQRSGYMTSAAERWTRRTAGYVCQRCRARPVTVNYAGLCIGCDPLPLGGYDWRCRHTYDGQPGSCECTSCAPSLWVDCADCAETGGDCGFCGGAGVVRARCAHCAGDTLALNMHRDAVCRDATCWANEH